MVYHLPQREFDPSQTVGGDRNLASKSRYHAKWPSDRTINGPENFEKISRGIDRPEHSAQKSVSVALAC